MVKEHGVQNQKARVQISGRPPTTHVTQVQVLWLNLCASLSPSVQWDHNSTYLMWIMGLPRWC